MLVLTKVSYEYERKSSYKNIFNSPHGSQLCGGDEGGGRERAVFGAGSVGEEEEGAGVKLCINLLCWYIVKVTGYGWSFLIE